PRSSPSAQRRRDSSIPPNVQEHGRVDGIWTVQSDAPQDDAAQLLRPLLTKLFRRPLSKDQLARYTDLVADRLAGGEGFEEAMRMAISAAICSPEFLYRLEKPGRLDEWAVANRLSYFLWNSPPDEKLGEQAAAGSLKRGGDTMRQQARRLLADPRSE